MKNQKGFADLVMIMSMVAISGIVIYGMMSLISSRIDISAIQAESDLENSYVMSGANTFSLTLRVAEREYIQSVNGCDSANSFFVALTEGSGCPTASVTVFAGGSPSTDPGEGSLYDYPSAGCAITPTSSNCVNPSKILVSIGATAAQKISDNTYQFYLVNVVKPGRFAQFKLIRKRDGFTAEYNIMFKNYFTNTAHMDNNYFVIQESPDPLANCPGTNWGPYEIFDSATSTCNLFNQLGGGSGLAFYKGQYFGFRPFDGVIVALSNSSSPIVNHTTGQITTESPPGFLPYPDPANHSVSLLNVDDITVIEDQIYFVAGQGDEAHIGYTSPAGVRTRVCDLGLMGWSQAYAGIAAASWSSALINKPTNPLNSYNTFRIAAFYLKTDTGDLLTAYVQNNAGGFSCHVMREETLQAIEMSRTMGFDRAVDERPFYIF